MYRRGRKQKRRGASHSGQVSFQTFFKPSSNLQNSFLVLRSHGHNPSDDEQDLSVCRNFAGETLGGGRLRDLQRSDCCTAIEGVSVTKFDECMHASGWFWSASFCLVRTRHCLALHGIAWHCLALLEPWHSSFGGFPHPSRPSPAWSSPAATTPEARG